MFMQALLVMTGYTAWVMAAAPPDQRPEVKPARPGMLITESIRITPGVYELADSADRGAVIISGNDLIVDFQGATLPGNRTPC